MIERPTKIVAAAILMKSEKQGKNLVYSLPAPNRHHDVLHCMHDIHGHHKHIEQGFLTDTGIFVRRKPALLIAKKAGQMRTDQPQCHPSELFSEDLW